MDKQDEIIDILESCSTRLDKFNKFSSIRYSENMSIIQKITNTTRSLRQDLASIHTRIKQLQDKLKSTQQYEQAMVKYPEIELIDD